MKRLWSLAATVIVASLASAGAALAAGNPVNAGTPFASGPPAVAVDAAGDGIVAWANTKDLGAPTTRAVLRAPARRHGVLAQRQFDARRRRTGGRRCSGRGGGPSGFGVFESNENGTTTVYQHFDQTTRSFGPMVTVGNQHELYAAGSQDGAGGAYGTYLLGGPGGPLALSYSADGGKSFTSGTLNANRQGGIDHVISSVNPGGQGWAAWEDHATIMAQSFGAADAISPAVIGGGAASNGASVTLTITCASLPARSRSPSRRRRRRSNSVHGWPVKHGRSSLPRAR